MYQDRILLTCKDILEKEFKIDTRGYRPQDVDKFLDAIIRDYEEFLKIIKEIESDKKELIEDNIRLKNFKIIIIHGIGSGIVKASVHEALRVNKNVIEYKTDNFNSGCTIIKLKI